LAAGLGAGALASSASAATSYVPVAHACDYKLGPNILKLTLNGTDFLYPVVLHDSADGEVNGYLADSGLPPGHQVLRVHGDCHGSNLVFDENYPGGQGNRMNDLAITQISPHRGTAVGVFDETGPLAENGTAAFVFQVYHR
jgi:hypothetical protein